MNEQEYAVALDEKNKRIAALEKQNEELQNQYQEALSANEALVAELEKEPQPVTAANASSGSLQNLSFDYEGKTIGFNFYKMKHRDQWITAEEVVVSEKLQKELVEMESGMLKF